MRTDAISYSLASNASSSGSAINIRGGSYIFHVTGTVGGATISLQTLCPDGSTWTDVNSIYGGTDAKTTTLPFALTSIELPAGQVRLGVSGGTPSGLNAWLTGIG